MAQITKDMIIADVIRMDEGTIPLFMQYGMHCVGCAIASRETIEQAAVVHGIDADQLVKALNDYFDTKEEKSDK